MLVDRDQLLQFLPALGVEILRALEEDRLERQPHGKAIAVAMLAPIAVFADPLGILQHHLELVGRKILGHHPVLAQHLEGDHGQVVGQCLLDVLEVDRAVFLGKIPAIAGIVVFRAEGELGFHPGMLHHLADLGDAVLVIGAAGKMLEIGLPGDVAELVQVLVQVGNIGIADGDPEAEPDVRLVGGRLDVGPAILVLGQETAGARAAARLLPAIIDLQNIDAELAEQRQLLEDKALGSELGAARIGRTPGIGQDDRIAGREDRIAGGVKLFQRQLQAIVAALVEDAPGRPALAETVWNDLAWRQAPAGHRQAPGFGVERAGVVGRLVDGLGRFLDHDHAGLAVFHRDAAGPVDVLAQEDRPAFDCLFLEHVLALVVAVAGIVVVAPVEALVLHREIERQVIGAGAGFEEGGAAIAIGRFLLRQPFGIEAGQRLHPQLGAQAGGIREGPDHVLDFQLGQRIADGGDDLDVLGGEPAVVILAGGHRDQLGGGGIADRARQIPVALAGRGLDRVVAAAGQILQAGGLQAMLVPGPGPGHPSGADGQIIVLHQHAGLAQGQGQILRQRGFGRSGRFQRPGQGCLRPVGMVAIIGVARIGHHQLELGNSGHLHGDLPGGIVEPHHAAVEQLLAIAKDLEDDAALLVALHRIVDADPGLETGAFAAQRIDDLAGRMRPQAGRKFAAGDRQRRAADRFVDLELAIALGGGFRIQLSQPDFGGAGRETPNVQGQNRGKCQQFCFHECCLRDGGMDLCGRRRIRDMRFFRTPIPGALPQAGMVPRRWR